MAGQRGHGRWLPAAAAAAFAAGAIGVAATLAGLTFPLRGALVLAFVAIAPAVAVARLFIRLDAVARMILGGAAAIVINLLAAEALLAAGQWSPRRSLLAVVGITAGLACLGATGRARAGRAAGAGFAAARLRRPQPAPARAGESEGLGDGSTAM
jgi:hypothetical protein